MVEQIQNEILKKIDKFDYEKGLSYDEDFIKYNGIVKKDTGLSYNFLVQSESSFNKYLVDILINNNSIIGSFCTCPQFSKSGSCKHIAACLISYSNTMFNVVSDNNIKKQSLQFLNKLKESKIMQSGIKEEVYIKPYLVIEHGYYGNSIGLYLKIGQNKMYALLSKLSPFLSAIRRNESFNFGTNFTFDSQKHYINKRNEDFLNFIYLINQYSYHYGNNNIIYLNDESVKKVLETFKDGIYIYDNDIILPIEEKFPINFTIHKENNEYKLELVEKNKEIIPLTEDNEYILSNDKIYHLNKKQRLLLENCLDYSDDKIIFEEKDFNDFQKNMLGIIKDNLMLDDTTKDIITQTKPIVKIYLDFNNDNITGDIIFSYDSKEISYFDENVEIIRDYEYEQSVVINLVELGFHRMNTKFLMDDFDLVCDFLQNNLDELTEKYEVYTSEKMKNTSIIKDNKVSASFGIGKDNILHFDFDLGLISNDEIDEVLNSYKNKKKYYRLKNGEILSLEEEGLLELDNLIKELELTSNDIKEKTGVIPKYRALYLDSLKNNKYSIIKTNSLFQNFINQFKEFQNKEIEFNDDEIKILRPYQIDGVKWLYTITKCGFGGILADEMGLGKSLQTITFIKKMLKENTDSKFLIVTPTSLTYNWEREIIKFAPELSYHVFAENRNDRRSNLESFNGNVYITSYGLLREDLEIYNNINFEVCIIDEAQNIKNPKTGLTVAVKSINANTKIALTGTPIENSIVELWSIFDFLMPGFLSSLVKFQQKYKVKDFDDETNKLLSSLKEQVKPFILRRKKKDVIKDLPDKIENNVYIDLTETQKKIYAAEVKKVKEEMDEKIKNGGFEKNKMVILSLLTKLRQICIDPSIIFDSYNEVSSKMENLLKIIQELIDNGHKILLFTSFKTALLNVKNILDEKNISNYTITGDVSGKNRQQLVDSFNKDDTNVFLITLKSGGTGLNLTSADVVIHLDMWWNPQVENQATDRAHRIGQTKTVEVIKLICKGTIEEKIIELQEKKKVLSDKILEGEMDDSMIIKNLDEEDIRSLLAYENK
ncbi:MAG: hypothetical protein E7158_04430 [Firmicutes bacterium]|nr:hypothetical protein [Bacillota bacterium]